ncbi:MAG: hypothetical protein ACTSRK_15330 [Promethearchaeota archaeon]
MPYIDERNHLGNISEHLTKMEVPFEFKDIGESPGDIFPAVICTYRCNSLDFDVILYNIGKWINVKCMVMNLAAFTDDALQAIFSIALELNYDLPEVTFSKHSQRLYIEVDCLVGIKYDDFAEEFNSIGDGIDMLINVLNKQKEINLESTSGQLDPTSFPKKLST